MDEWRTLLYPLGFVASFAFGARFIVQWLQSEKQKTSFVTPLFWKLSLAGNIALLIHSLIQFQVHIALMQACNATISWRNLNLMQREYPPVSFKTVCLLLAGAAAAVFSFFISHDYLSEQTGEWFRVPVAPWQNEKPSEVSFLWHLLGTFAFALFSCRFWVQWGWAEWEKGVSIHQLPLAFWWLSLSGALLSILYFLHIGDTVNLIGPLVGIVPYGRNLMLMMKRESEAAKA